MRRPRELGPRLPTYFLSRNRSTYRPHNIHGTCTYLPDTVVHVGSACTPLNRQSHSLQ